MLDLPTPGKPEIAWDDPAARDELVSLLVNDALAVLAELEARYPGGDGLEAKQAADAAVALRADVQHRQALKGDPHGVYGAGAEVMEEFTRTTQ